MSVSIRENLITTWLARLAAVSSSPLVVETGLDDETIAKTLQDGKPVFEVLLGNDVAEEPMSTADQFRFPAAVVMHLPESSVAGGGGNPRTYAHTLAEQVYSTYGPSAQEDMGGYAQTARCTMFASGVYLTDSGTRAVLHGVEFTYRFVRGNPQGSI